MSKVKKIFKWTLTSILGLFFINAGLAKFWGKGAEVWMNEFDKWGYPDNLYLIIGGLEAIGGLIMFFPKYANKAIFVLVGIMLGACVTHLINSEPSKAIVTLIIFSLLTILLFLNKNIIKPHTQDNPQT
ncbi:DoxX family protein [Flavobacteriaceae bacterium AU392]|nr:DoxX family protein [Flavobacteriaceae bacterium]RKM85897.1 DoxX family protein [Flavobacteriaceae bacterium AU392]